MSKFGEKSFCFFMFGPRNLFEKYFSAKGGLQTLFFDFENFSIFESFFCKILKVQNLKILYFCSDFFDFSIFHQKTAFLVNFVVFKAKSEMSGLNFGLILAKTR